MATVHKNLRTIHQSQDKQVLVAESSPQIRTIKMGRYQLQEDDSPALLINHTFYLSFPFMQFYLTSMKLSGEPSLHLTFSKQPILNIREDEVSFPFLPNVYKSKLKVCMALNRIYNTLNIDKNIPNETIMERAIEKFWNSPFYSHFEWYGNWIVPNAICKVDLNQGYIDWFNDIPAVEQFSLEAIKQFRIWEEGTRKEGVDFISNLEWPQAFKDAPDILQNGKSFISGVEASITTLTSCCH